MRISGRNLVTSTKHPTAVPPPEDQIKYCRHMSLNTAPAPATPRVTVRNVDNPLYKRKISSQTLISFQLVEDSRCKADDLSVLI